MRAAATLLVLAGPAAAQVGADGHHYATTCNASGYVLRSLYPLTRFVQTPEGPATLEGRETIYLGRSCDAAREGFGAGTWCWANGGFAASFPEGEFGFPRQSPGCPEGATEPVDLLALDCACR